MLARSCSERAHRRWRAKNVAPTRVEGKSATAVTMVQSPRNLDRNLVRTARRGRCHVVADSPRSTAVGSTGFVKKYDLNPKVQLFSCGLTRFGFSQDTAKALQAAGGVGRPCRPPPRALLCVSSGLTSIQGSSHDANPRNPMSPEDGTLILCPLPRIRSHPCTDGRQCVLVTSSRIHLGRNLYGVRDPRVSREHIRFIWRDSVPLAVAVRRTLYSVHGRALRLERGASVVLEAGAYLHLVDEAQTPASGRSSSYHGNSCAYLIEAVEPLLLRPLPPDPFCRDGRQPITHVLDTQTEIEVGRSTSEAPNAWGLTNPRVHRRHMAVTGGPGMATCVAALGAQPLQVLRHADGTRVQLAMGQATTIAPGDQIHLLATRGDGCGYRVISASPLLLQPLDACLLESRAELRIPLGSTADVVLGRASGGVADPRVSQQHLRLSCASDQPRMLVSGQHPVILLRGHGDGAGGGGASLDGDGLLRRTLPPSHSTELQDGDEILLVDEARIPGSGPSAHCRGDPCAYRVRIEPPAAEGTGSRSPSLAPPSQSLRRPDAANTVAAAILAIAPAAAETSLPDETALAPRPTPLGPAATPRAADVDGSQSSDGLASDGLIDRVGASSWLWNEEARRYGEEAVATWVGCDRCGKWRPLPPPCNAADLPEVWYCENHPDSHYNSCSASVWPVPLGGNHQAELPACSQGSVCSRGDLLQVIGPECEAQPPVLGRVRGNSPKRRRGGRAALCYFESSEGTSDDGEV